MPALATPIVSGHVSESWIAAAVNTGVAEATFPRMPNPLSVPNVIGSVWVALNFCAVRAPMPIATLTASTPNNGFFDDPVPFLEKVCS